MTQPETVFLDGQSLTLEDIWDIAHQAKKVGVDEACLARLSRARDLVEDLANSGKPIYGINTGFGFLAETPIPPEKLEQLQYNLIVSHAVGVGEPLNFALARALMLLRANTLAVGHSGCRALILEHMLKLLNTGCAPYVPKKGSVGASGDLAPLAHVALLLLGEGPAFIQGRQGDGHQDPKRPRQLFLLSQSIQRCD